MADPTTKKILQDLARDETLKNKTCADCGNPNPQWASISFANFICLQCAGEHRGFGVHISFVRSITMDAWQDDQIRRMKLGGNAALMEFLRTYPEGGGYKDGMNTHDKYHCWAATQYREKLTAAVEGREWSPSSPPPVEPAARPSSAQGLRKSRASARGSPASSTLRQSSNSPAATPAPEEASGDRKAANESYFASLGAVNAARRDDVPPSQGGRYTGFGSTPDPVAPEHLSSAAAPTLQDLQSDPVKALSKGWSLFAGAVAGASRAVNENVLQPGMERVADPELRARVGGYVGAAQQRAAEVAGSANAWGRERFGVDVGERVGVAVDMVRGGPSTKGYETVDRWGDDGGEESSALYADAGDDEFFKDKKTEKGTAKADDNWEEWKQF